jgi:hypothetical protein
MTRKPDPLVERAITLTNLCQALHVLPRAGGLYDQDPRDIYMISCVLSAQAEKAEMDSKKAQQGR